MHIGFRTSGGRGEYELVGSAGTFSSGDLEGWAFHMRWPDGKMRDTNLWLNPALSGKPRLRSLIAPPLQIGRIISSMLLMPEPRRDMRLAGNELPILKRAQYVVTRIGFSSDVSFSIIGESVEFLPNYVEVTNRVTSDLLGVESRWNRVKTIYDLADRYDPRLTRLLRQHQAALDTGNSITATLPTLVRQIGELLHVLMPAHVAGEDALPTLELLALVIPDLTADLPPPDSIAEDEPEIRIRISQEYRMARSRGASARVFANQVLSAYHNRCAFCGLVLSGVDGIVSGIDAAHILAWSRYDLDVVQNGIALCKLHHWAFDTAIVAIVLEREGYVLRFTQLALRLDEETRQRLDVDGFVIPPEWLPDDVTLRPSNRYLKRLYQDLEFVT
ncbi:MAG: HNH endonuclease [Acidimicrobiales bacterium]